MLRISGGEARGRRLKGPRGLDFRPTTGRVKEFIFSIIGPDIRNAVVLDLFSGSGSLGIEALSRGADHVTFIEQLKSHIQILEENLSTCRFQDRSRVIKGEVFRTLDYLGRQEIQFDFILADPPFKMAMRSRIVESVGKNHLLSQGGELIIEHQFNDADSDPKKVKMIRQRKFGHCMVSVYE